MLLNLKKLGGLEEGEIVQGVPDDTPEVLKNIDQFQESQGNRDCENIIRIPFTKKTKEEGDSDKERKRAKRREYKKKYKCDCCEEFRTKSLDSLQKHKFEKHDQTLCSQCGANFRHYVDLRAHLNSHREPIKCDDCEEVFKDPKKRKWHMKKEHGKSRYSMRDETKVVCQECGIVLQSQAGLESHYKRKHSGDPSQKVPCPHCDYTDWTQGGINGHIRRVHDINFKPASCPFCGKLIKRLRDHLRRTQCNLPENERTLKVYKCEPCNKNFSEKHGYHRHVRQFHGEGKKNQKCDLCNYATYSKFNLFIHVRRMHEGKPLKRSCPYCSKEVIKLEHHISLFHPEFDPERPIIN